MQALFLLPASPTPKLSVTGGRPLRAEPSRVAHFPRPVRPGAPRLRTTLCAVLLTLVWVATAQAQSATYRVTFEGKFTTSALASGVSVPSGEHFTTLIGAVHNGSATFWSSGAMASTQPRNDAGNNEYIVTVRATGGTAERAMTSEQTITVTDVDEPPEAPEAPTVRAASLTSLAVTWTAPANTGPAITGYDVRYKATGGAFTNWNHDSANTTTTITDLTPNTRYYVQVRARNHEGPSDWSESGALPNIIWIMADDLGYGDLGSYGQTRILTPNLDRMASEGMRFTDAYAGSPICAPSRSVLMTGQHAGRTRVWWNYSLGLWDEDVTVAELLGGSGYATALIGKWALGEEDSPGAPWRQGFDHFFGYLNQGHAHNYYPEFLIRNPGTRVPLNNIVVPAPYNDRDLYGVATQREDYSHDLFISDALDWVERNENTPFFLYLALTIPHANTAALRRVIPEELAGHHERIGMEVPDAGAYQNEDWPGPQKGTAAMITRMDAGVGQIIDKLKELNIDEQTVVFFTSDNGPHSQGGNDSRFFNSNGPLQGEKKSLHDGGIRVPMIVRWPGRVPAGTVSNLVWYFADFLPTMAELVGFDNPDGIDGTSILSDLLGGSSRIGDRLIYWWNGGRVDGARWGRWKAVRESKDQPLELFDLHQDLSERNDLASTNQDVATTMLDYMASAVTNETEKIWADKPEVSSVEFTSSPASGQNGAYKLGDVIEVTATFSDGVTVTTTDGTPQIGLIVGSAARQADYVSGSTTQQLLFQYTVQATDEDTDGVIIRANGLKRNGGRIRKNGTVLYTILTHGPQTNHPGHKVDGVAPTVSKLEISSNPGSDRTYAAGDEIEVTVTFRETVEVTGTPRLQLELGGGLRTAAYRGGTGTAALVFAYEVADGESDTDGLGVEADSLSGGTITDKARNAAVLEHGSLSADSGHKVDAVKPELAASGGAVVDGTRLTLTWDEPLDGRSTPASGDFTVSGGDRARTVTRVRVSGSTVLLTLDTGAEHREAGIQMSYTPGANPIQDAVGNDARPLANRVVENNTRDTTAPVITTTSPILVPENETAVATLNATDDTPIDQLTWTIPSGADTDQFTLGSTGVLAFSAAKDYEIPDDANGDRTYEVTVQVSDDNNNTATANLEVTVENVIELTTLAGPEDIEYAENQAVRVATYTASSAEDRDGITWILSGDDKDHFSIDTPPGVLRFHIDPDADNSFPKLPDFEAPDDEDGDNDYAVTVEVSDGSTTETLDVVVTVTNANEAGTVTLSTTRPRLGVEVRATPSDPDEGSGLTVTAWQWERSAGRNAWEVIAGATAASYTPTAADTGAYLRVTATYTDSSAVGQTAQAVSAEVVTAELLSGLSVTTNAATADPDTWAMRPEFSADILHYAVGCRATVSGDTMRLDFSATAGTRVAVNGIQEAENATVEVLVEGNSEVRITLTTGSNGAHTTYVVHCVDSRNSAIERIGNEPGASTELISVYAQIGPTRRQIDATYLAIIDANGVPRWQRRLNTRASHFKAHPDGKYPYSYGHYRSSSYGYRMVILDENLKKVDEVTTTDDLQRTGAHDFAIRENGNYVFEAYEPAYNRDFSAYTDENDNPYGTSEETEDSIIEEVNPDGDRVFFWNSWKDMYLNDCLQHRFPNDYAHINSVQVVDDADIIASFRGCSQVWRIDRETGAGEWLLGRSNRSDAEWESQKGIRTLKIVGDPYGEFCGQHSARLIPNGHLVLFDNGWHCLEDPETRDTQRTDWGFSRVVEYALDIDNGEAVFVRQHCLGNECEQFSEAQGHIHRMDSGHWLVSWGRGAVDNWDRTGPYPEASLTEVDPLTNEELLSFKITHPDFYIGGDVAQPTRAYPVEFVALADTPGPLTAEIVTRAATSAFHTGSGTAQVVVAFSRPVKDFAATTPSLSVMGATVTNVAPHIEAGAPANAYLVTLEPEGDGDISFALVTGRSCAEGGICTADGTSLSAVPETAHTITGPVQVSFDEAAYTVTEGGTVEVVVELDRTHDRPGPLEIPLRVQSDGTDAGDTEYTVPTIVTFDTTETEKTVSVTTYTDDIIEESETVALGFGDLPPGVKPGTTTTTRVTIADQTRTAEFTLTLPDTVAEDDGAAITARIDIDNGVTFSTEQTFTLTFSGAAERGSDYTVDADTLRLQKGLKRVTDDIIEMVDDIDVENAETITVTAQHNGRQIGSQTVTILASDQSAETPHISIHAKRNTAGEAEGATFIVTRTGDTDGQLRVAVRVTQEGNISLMGSPLSHVTFGVRRETVDLNIPTEDDDIVEGETETSVVRAEVLSDTTNAPPLYLVGSPATAEVTVEDDDKAEFGVSVSPATVTEGETVQVIVTISNDVTFASDQPLTLAFSGNAEQGTDYTVGSDTLTLAAGQPVVTTLLHVLDDGAKELEETIGIAVQHDGTQSESQLLRIAASEDTEPPTFDHAEVPPDGRSLILTFSEPLAEAAHHRPAATAFTVTVAGEPEPRAVTTVTVSGAHVVLGLTNPVRPGQAVTVGYTMPTGRPAPPVLQDPAGHAVVSFSDEAVENQSQFGRQPPGGPPGGGPPSGGGGGGPACTEDLHGNTAAQATGIALATETAGAICPAADVDYFALTAPGRGLVFVDTPGSVNLRGTLWQNEEVLATGPTGRGQGTRLGALVQAGAVVVAVQGQGGATGEYALVIAFRPGYLENPGDDSFQSGIGVISGWVCEAESVEIEIETAGGAVHRYEAGYGTERADTAQRKDGTPLCGDTDNGFGLLFNWNLLGAGEHTIVALVDEVELGRATVTVTTVGEGEEEEFLRDVAGTCVVADFPTAGETVTLAWQETKQNFVITSGTRPAGMNMAGVAGEGYLENPGPNSFQSGIGVISGWVCEAERVEIEIETAQGDVHRYEAAYGTERADTALPRKDGTPLCGDTDNGFGLLFNWNRLGAGEHTVRALVDEEELGRATVRVTTVGEGAEEEFLRDVAGECTVADFPMDGQTTTLAWQETSQNFVITDLEQSRGHRRPAQAMPDSLEPAAPRRPPAATFFRPPHNSTRDKRAGLLYGKRTNR